ncbi:hypothetical protein VPNG_02650 [Cytospora leucostoma]|uniref:Uncharacterized protein n=1 Tax=Cytospora leucostoma TaxID=1230097 RepID=A0A423XI96_9PEZI|nr:hypothetical protein VPNG_02650 [Cytospora leucostoma]
MCRPKIIKQKIRAAPPMILPIMIPVLLTVCKSGWVESVPDGFTEEEARTLVCITEIGLESVSGVAEADQTPEVEVTTDEAADVTMAMIDVAVDSEIAVTPLNVRLVNPIPLSTDK